MIKKVVPSDINLTSDQWSELVSWCDLNQVEDLSISKSVKHFDRTGIGIVKNFVESLEGDGLHSNRSNSRNVQLFADTYVARIFAAINYNDDLPINKSDIVNSLSNYYELHQIGNSENVYAFGYYGTLPTKNYIKTLTELICTLAEGTKNIGGGENITNIWRGGVNSSLFINTRSDGKGIDFCVVMIPLHYLDVANELSVSSDYSKYSIGFESDIINSYDQIGIYDKKSHQYSFVQNKMNIVSQDIRDVLLNSDVNDNDNNSDSDNSTEAN